MTVQALFFLSLIVIAYAYLGYPMTLWCLAAFKMARPLDQKNPWLPRVSLLISVYNEESIIEAKLRNSLKLDYPKELFEIIVLSDGSTDKTNGIVSRFANEGVKLRFYEGRIGKTACLNHAIRSVSGDIVIFSDANSMYPPQVVRALVGPFADPTIGFVTGGTNYVSDGSGHMGESIGLYSRLERLTKSLESRLGSCVGADGAMFAIRSSLFEPLDRADINDLVIPLRIVRAGFRGIYAADAFCIEVAAKETAREFDRQVRIAARTIRAVMTQRALLNPLVFGLFAFQLFSHKLCKLIVPFLLLSVMGCSFVLAPFSEWYLFLMAVQVVLYTTAWITVRASRPRELGVVLSRLFNLFHSFIVVNVAIGVAWVRYWKGDTFTTWAPAR